jgi:hypothetical protein
MTNEEWVRSHPAPPTPSCAECQNGRGRGIVESLLYVGRFLPDDGSAERPAFLCRNGHMTLGGRP